MEIINTISDFIPYSFVIIIAVLFCSIISRLILGMKHFNLFNKYIEIICFPGIVMHEFSHYLFCKLGGCQVIETKLFVPNDPQALGYVAHEIPESFLTSLTISLGPIIINGFCVSTILYFLPNLNEFLKYYLIFALVLGAQPSIPDLKNIFIPFKINGNKAFYELFVIFISFIPACFAIWNIHSVYEINWFLFSLIYFGTLIVFIGCYRLFNY
ncbi:MAG: hypothetical protein ACTSR3_20885 [Candidatus Helarchaeota archaeon]